MKRKQQKKKLPKGLYLRGNIYWMRLADENGRMLFRSTGIDDLDTAMNILAKNRVDIAEGRFLDKDAARLHTLQELLDEYSEIISPDKADSTQERDKGMSVHLIKFFGDCTLDAITVQNMERYKAERLRFVKPATVRNELQLLSHALENARKWSWIRENKAKDFEFRKLKANTIIRWLKAEEEKALLEACGNELEGQLRDMVIFYAYTGCSQEEGLKLVWSQIDFQNKTVVFKRQKTERKNRPPRVVPLNETAMSMLQKLSNGVKCISGNIFHVKGRQIKQYEFSNAFRRAEKLSKIAHCRPHDLRHTFASRLAQKGVSLYKIAELLGHSSTEVTKKYAHLCPSEMHADVSVLDALDSNENTKTRQCGNQ